MAPKKQKQQVIPEIDPNSSFTPESFERELKNLAAKAKEETWGKVISEQLTVYTKSAVLLGLIAISANVSELSLSPVYGSIPSGRWHPYVVMASAFIGWSTNLVLRRNLPFKPEYLIAVIAIYIPMVQFMLFKLSNTFTGYWGPTITESLTLLPLMSLSISCVATYLEEADFTSLPRWLGDAMPGIGSWAFYKLAERTSAQLLHSQMGKSFFQTRMGLQMILGASYSLVAPSKLLLWTIPGLLHTAVLNTHVASPVALQSLNKTLMTEGFMILDRRESITGYVSVVENMQQGFRVMRCDHSLLGGEWTKFPAQPVAEPIYGVFVMLEAVRLVTTVDRAPDKEAKALVM